MAVLFVPMILLMSINNGVITRVSKFPALIFLGEISYCVYILQRPATLWAKAIFIFLKAHNPVLIFYSSFILLIFVSGITYTYLELPLRKWIRSFTFNEQ